MQKSKLNSIEYKFAEKIKKMRSYKSEASNKIKKIKVKVIHKKNSDKKLVSQKNKHIEAKKQEIHKKKKSEKNNMPSHKINKEFNKEIQKIQSKSKPLLKQPEILEDKELMNKIVTMPSESGEDSEENIYENEIQTDSESEETETEENNNQKINNDVNRHDLPEEKESKVIIEKKIDKKEKIDNQEEQISDVEVYQEKIKGNVIDSYTIKIDGASADIKIVKNEIGLKYFVNIPKISRPTTALLNDLREELIAITSVSMQELIDPKAFSSIKKKFKEEAAKLIRKKIPTIKEETESFLVGTLMQEMLGIGKIEYLINDPNLEEIVIVSAKEPIKVYSKKYGWLSTDILLEREEVTMNYSNIIARRVGRQITVLSPLLDAHLVTGDRVNAVLYPINTKGNTIVIRKFARDPYTIVDLINNKTCDLEAAALLWLAIEYEMSVIISGGTASGKTVLLNSCMLFIPPNQRIISIEDTKELALPEFLYWTPLVTRLPNAEGKGSVTMLDLLINSLRMRPDRIILGEMRKHEEAIVLFEAMHTGHSVYATMHADSAAETISRLVHPPLDIPANLLEAINLNVVMFRDRRRGIRRILQIAEIETEGEKAKANTLYRWSPETDQLVKHSKSSRFFEQISRHTSMSEEDINKELNLKKKILSWLISHNIRKMDDIGKTMNLYYLNKELLLKKIAKNDVKFILNY